MIINNSATRQKVEGSFLHVTDEGGNMWRISDSTEQKGIEVQLICPADYRTHYAAMAVEPQSANVVALIPRRRS